MKPFSAAPESAPESQPVAVTQGHAPRIPVVCASPHSGCGYPAAFLAQSALDLVRLRSSEDSFVDRLLAGAPARGASLLCALFPRAYVDVNREAWELDPAMFVEPLPDFVNSQSARVAQGLGSIARVVSANLAIYRTKLRFADAVARIEHYYRPYHRCLAALLDETHADFGRCLLLDGHSMPDMPSLNVDFVLGDGFGASCAPHLMNATEQFLIAEGLRVRRNHPYAGAFTLCHYGKPAQQRHALQIEINRALYMNETTRQPTENFAKVAVVLERLVAALGQCV